MKEYTTKVVEMTVEELTIRFKKFVKAATGYEGEIRVRLDSQDAPDLAVEVNMDLTDEQEDLLEEAGVCTICSYATGMDLLIQIYGENASFDFDDSRSGDGIKITTKI